MKKEACRAIGQVGLIVLLSSFAFAQQAEAPPDLPSSTAAAAQFMAGLIESLELTDEQVPTVEQVVAEMIERQRKTLGDYTGGGEQLDQASLRTMQEELAASQQQAHDDLSGVLSEEQIAGFDEALMQQRTQAAGEAIVMRLSEPLSLTDEQSEQLVPVFAQNIRARGEMMQKIRSQGRAFGAMRGQRMKMQELQRDLEDQLRTILTDEQMATYLEIAEMTRSQMRERGGGRRQR